jgi:hypothetical protein
MTNSSPIRKATAAQQAEVRRLAAEDVPVRQIAAAVFGDARFRGRVERILKSELYAQPASDAEPLVIEGLSRLEIFTAKDGCGDLPHRYIIGC